MVARGEVWWYEEPNEEPRPHLLLTRPEAVPVLQRVMAVPSTRSVRGIASEVGLDASDGMPYDCALTLDNVTTVRKALLTRYITTLGPARMEAVCEALRFATAC